MIDKELIRKRFGKSLSTYSQNAITQKHMSDVLLSNLVKYTGNNFGKCLEIGCGSGFLTEKLLEKISFEEIFVNDLVENSLNQAKISSNKIKSLYGDCEMVPFPCNLDLIISNATFQWVKDFTSLCDKIHSSLKPQGVLAFSTFDEENLYQIKAISGKSLDYYSKAEITNILNKNFKIIYSTSERFDLEFDSVYEILNHLKLCGANSLAVTKWTKKDLNEFGSKYNELFRTSRGKLILTYKPLYFICAKIG